MTISTMSKVKLYMQKFIYQRQLYTHGRRQRVWEEGGSCPMPMPLPLPPSCLPKKNFNGVKVSFLALFHAKV